jgi:hypothetical protein
MRVTAVHWESGSNGGGCLIHEMGCYLGMLLFQPAVQLGMVTWSAPSRHANEESARMLSRVRPYLRRSQRMQRSGSSKENLKVRANGHLQGTDKGKRPHPGVS